MAVIPGASILRGVPAISKVITRRDRALSDAVDPVHLHGQVLPYSMPMDTGAVVA